MISLKKLTTIKKKYIKRKLPTHDKPVTIDNCNKSTKQNFDHILKQSNLTTKDVADFIKKAIFWWKAMKS